jgi:hypothetical protein
MRPMYSIAMNEARCGAVCHRKFVPVLVFEGKTCSYQGIYHIRHGYLIHEAFHFVKNGQVTQEQENSMLMFYVNGTSTPWRTLAQPGS